MNHARLGVPAGGSGDGARGASGGGCQYSHWAHWASEALAAARSHAHSTARSSATGSVPSAGLAAPCANVAGAKAGIGLGEKVL